MADTRSVSVTFRFPAALFKELKEESEHKKVSLNTLLNQIVTAHVEWHARATNAGFISVRRTLVRKLMDLLTEGEIDNLAKNIAGELKDASLIVMGAGTQRSLLGFLERWVNASGFTYRHVVENNTHTFIIQHEMGHKWAYYLDRISYYLTEEVAAAKPQIEISDKIFVLKIKIKAS
jgi:hypothetical protein